jgi:hypothetical protein
MEAARLLGCHILKLLEASVVHVNLRLGEAIMGKRRTVSWEG